MILINLIEIDEIINIQKNVTEKILKTNFKKFILTILDEYNIEVDKYDIFYQYSNHLKNYNLFIVKRNHQINIPLPYIFTYLYDLKKYPKNSIDLFLTTDFFVLYKNGKMQTYKTNIEKSSNEEIKIFVEKVSQIKIDNIYTILDDELNTIKNAYKLNYKKLTKPNNINFKHTISALYIGLFVISILIILFFIYNNFNKKEIIKVETIKAKITKVKTIKPNLPIIKSIIDDNVLIDNVWLKVGDKYNNYELISIKLKYIELKFNNNIYKVMYD